MPPKGKLKQIRDRRQQRGGGVAVLCIFRSETDQFERKEQWKGEMG